MAKAMKDRVSIGKFEILTTYTYARALRDGLPEDQAKERGMVAAIMGAHSRLGLHTRHGDDFQASKEAAEKKKKTTITAQAFDRQVRDQLGGFFDETFLPLKTRLVQAGLSYEDVKRAVKIPSTWGAKLGGEPFRERAEEALKKIRRK
jgi:hypothetical protein